MDQHVRRALASASTASGCAGAADRGADPVVILASGTTATPGRWAPSALLRADPRARGDRRLRGHRRLPVLRLLRGHAHPDVLPDRRLRRPATGSVRRGQVPALQPGRRPAHAGRGDRPLRRVGAPHGHRRTCSRDLAKIDYRTAPGRWLFLGFFFAFAIKAPMLPLHTWLPDTAGRPRPAPRRCWSRPRQGRHLRDDPVLPPLFPEASQWATPVVMVLAVIGIIYGALLAIGQRGHQAADRLHVDRRTSASSCWASSR